MSSAPPEEFDLGQGKARQTQSGGLLRGSAIIAAALGFTQVMAYVLSVTAAKTLPPDAFGSFGALLNLVLIGTVLAFGLQAVIARLVVNTAPDDAGALGTRALGFSFRIAAIVGAILLALSPSRFRIAPAEYLAGSVRRAHAAAAHAGRVPVRAGAGTRAAWPPRRPAAGQRRTALRLRHGWTAGVRLGGRHLRCHVLGHLAGAAVGMVLVRPMVSGPALDVPGLRSQVLHASHALLALYVATSIDVLLARFWLPGAESGVYAVGALVSKVAFWLPSFVAVVTFPRMADDRRGQTTAKAAAAVAAIGAIIVIGLAALPDLVLGLIAGPEYAALGPYLWLFGLIGAAFSLAQFLLYGHPSR